MGSRMRIHGREPFRKCSYRSRSLLCFLKVTFADNKFVLPSSPASYDDLSINDCKLIVSQVFNLPNQYKDIVSSGFVDYRINDVSRNSIFQLDTTSLISDSQQSVKVTARQGGCSLMLIGLREKITPWPLYHPFQSMTLTSGG